jgi:hypothetical protein
LIARPYLLPDQARYAFLDLEFFSFSFAVTIQAAPSFRASAHTGVGIRSPGGQLQK